MTCPPLYAVVDPEACARAGRDPHAVARAFAEAGVGLLQVRVKAAGAAALLRLTREVMALAPRARVIVNDRPDVARLAAAGGVHVGQDDLEVSDVRTIIGAESWVGLSTHTIGQARAALERPVHYIAIGPVFETTTKRTGHAAVGLNLVREVAEMSAPRGIPVVAIGGITVERAPSVIAAGASSVCVISDLLKGDPGERALAFLQEIGA